jgi:Mn-dependent DtxR family transcriptional regulator
MFVTRRDVLEQLDAQSDADAEERTSVEALADGLAVDEPTVREHLDGLESCELARVAPDGNVRITVTGEELLALDLDEMIVVDPKTTDSE